MYSVFSEKLFEFYREIKGTSAKVFDFPLKHTVETIRDNLTYTSAAFTTNTNVLENEVESTVEMIMKDKELANLIYWVNNKILKEIDKIKDSTMDVRLRIATAMLNKIPMNQLTSIIMHDNFVKNIRDLKRDLMLEELPF